MTDAGIVFVSVLVFAWWVCPFLLVRQVRKSLRIQRAILEELQQLNALATQRTGEAAGGRFSHLAGEE